MTSILVIVQFVLVAFICICVLLQKSSSIGLGSYSGSNESLFGAKGPAGFLAKFTFIIGFLFLINTIALGYLYNKPSSIVEELKQLPKKDLLPSTPVLPAAQSVPFTQNLPVKEQKPLAKDTKPAKTQAVQEKGEGKPTKPATKAQDEKKQDLPLKDGKNSKQKEAKTPTK